MHGNLQGFGGQVLDWQIVFVCCRYPSRSEATWNFLERLHIMIYVSNFAHMNNTSNATLFVVPAQVIVALTGDVVFGNLVSCVPLRNPNLLPTNGDVPNSANHSGVNHAHHRVSQPSFSKEGWSRGSEDFQSIMTLKQTDSNRVPTANTITGTTV